MKSKAGTLFNNLFKQGSTAFKQLRELAISPEIKKVLKTWGITEASEMIGKTPQTIRNLEKSGKIKEAIQQKTGARSERIYTLKEINEIRDQLGTRPHKPEGHDPAIIGFVNFKGGAGKTTTSITSAQYFAKKGYKVLFIDADSQGSATQMFGFIPDEDFEESDTLLNILVGKNQDIASVIRKTYWDGLDLIPANLSLYNAELIIPTQIAEHARTHDETLPFYNALNSALETVKHNYDIIIIDSPPSMGMISINAVFASNSLIMSMPPIIIDFASTIQFFKMVSEVLTRLPDKNYFFTKILLTKHNNRQNAKQLAEILKAYFGQYLMTSYMIESEALVKAGSDMKTLYEIDKIYGSKKTYDRAVQAADAVNEEIESLIKFMWSDIKSIGNVEQELASVVNE